MPIYPYSFTLPPVNKQDIPSNGVPGEFLGISAGGVLDWLPVSGGGGSGDMLKAENLSGLADYAIARTNIGLGLTSSPEFANLTLTSPSLASSAPVTISQTWNDLPTAFTALKVNATSTNSAAASKLLDLQVGSNSLFSVRKDGAIIGTNTNTIFAGGTGSFFPGRIHVGDYNFSVGSNSLVQIAIEVDGSDSANAVILNKDAGIYWSSLASANNIIALRSSTDLALRRDGAANTLALRNAGAPQTFNVYGTSGTNNTDYRRLGLYCPTTGEATIQSQFSTPLVVTGGSAPSTTATITFAAQASAFPVGSTVVVSGVTPSGYNGTYTVTASTTTSVSYTVAAALANWSSGGTAVVSGFTGTVSINGVPVGLGKGNFSGNVAIGTSALNANTTGTDNVAVGFEALALGTGNFETVAIGWKASRGSGARNTAIGYGANNLGASDSVSIGWASMYNLTGGSLNVAIGRAAGYFITGGSTSLTSCTKSLFLGCDTKALGQSQENQIVIGYDATGIGSNSVVLGNDSITKTALKGNVGIGTTSPTSKLDVAGAVTAAGYYTATSGGVSLVANGLWQQGTGHLTLASGAILGWSGQANVNIDQPGDTRLYRDEAYHLATRNGTNGQKFSVYGTYPGAAWERFTITAPTSGNVLLGTYKGTGGIARGLEFQTDGVTQLTLAVAGTATFAGSVTGTNLIATNYIGVPAGNGLVPNAGGGSDFIKIGSNNGSELVRFGYFGTAATSYISFGGVAVTSPALKRSSTTIQARLANDSDFAPIQGKLTTETAFTATTVVPTGFITLYDSTGTAYKVPCVQA